VSLTRKLFSSLNLVLSTISLFFAALIVSPFDRKGEIVNKIGRLWAIVHLKACGIGVSLEGTENISEPPYVFMCNHQSELDIFALLSSLDLSMKWIAKKELFSVPFLGRVLKMGKNISLDRENPRKALRAMNEAANRVKEGMNVVIFPEGTWSTDGTLLPFKKGGFNLALRTGAPVIPVGILGTRHLQPEDSFIPREKGLVRVKIGQPILAQKDGRAAKEELMCHVRSCIEKLTA
jgi:1-acyl-sn-glycerol-3-phosphate acyltransferase